MSNHSGSHMLNRVLKILENQGVYQAIGKEKTYCTVLEILKMSWDFDCNRREILDEIGERLGICYLCQNSANQLKNGICRNCSEEYYRLPS